MRRVLLLTMVVLALLFAFVGCAEAGEAGLYQFGGVAFPIASSADSGTTTALEMGGWMETIGGTITLVTPEYVRNKNEESISASAVQGMQIGNRIVLGLGPVYQRYDVLSDHKKPVDYVAFRIFTTGFLKSLGESSHQNWGIGAVLDYTPSLKQTVLSVGSVILF